MDGLTTFSLTWPLDTLMRYVDMSDHIPKWDEEQQRAFVLYALCEFPLHCVVLRERQKTHQPPYGVVDGRERLHAIQQFFKGGLILTREHFQGRVYEQCLDAFGDRVKLQDDFESLGIGPHQGGLFPRKKHVGDWNVFILRSGLQEHDFLIRGALNVRSEPTPPEILLQSCCQYLESVVSGVNRASFIRIPLADGSSASYQYNPAPGIYGGSVFLYIRDGAVFLASISSSPITGLQDFKARLKHLFPGCVF